MYCQIMLFFLFLRQLVGLVFLMNFLMPHVQDPSKFAAAAAPAATADSGAAPAAAAAEEKKEEPAEESDDDMGFSLFD